MFKKLAKAISNSCDKHGFNLSEVEIDLIAKDVLAAESFGNITTVDEVEQGEVFKWCKKEYIKLDANVDGCLCLAKDVLFSSKFDDEEANNWKTSSLRQKLGVVIGDFKGELVPFDRNLTTDDGLTEYGSCTDGVSLLTCDEYRKYRRFIPNCETWYWTITAETVGSYYVRYVSSEGSLCDYNAYLGIGGVRPLICLDNGTLVEVKE